MDDAVRPAVSPREAVNVRRLGATRAVTVAALVTMAAPLVPNTARASDLTVRTRAVRAVDATTLRIEGHVRWSNAWRNARNHDAVWLFAKYRGADGAVRHARIRNIVARNASVPVACQASADRAGATCAPSAPMRGEVAMDVVMELTTTGVAPDSIAATALHALEMVYIPAGPFVVGDADTIAAQQAAFYRSTAAGTPAGTYRIASEAAIEVAPRDGALYYQSRNQYQGDRGGPVPSAFPKGTRAFYIMKYELRQGDYAQFLNTLGSHAGVRDITTAGDYTRKRGTIRSIDGRFVAGAPERPANMVSWDDGIAFADWAGLRPLTEFEFTKAARGPAQPVAGDYPWGTNSKARLLRRVTEAGDLVSSGDADESRLGDDTRDVLGASYWWVMDLAGSVWEKVVTIGHPAGRAFRGTHGDGELTDGRATNDDWPRGDDNGGGYGYRGGGFYEWTVEQGRDPLAQTLNPFSPVAWRPYGSWGGAPRSVAYGFRAGRTAD